MKKAKPSEKIVSTILDSKLVVVAIVFMLFHGVDAWEASGSNRILQNLSTSIKRQFVEIVLEQ